MKKFISFLLIFALVFSCFSLTSFAEGGKTYYVDSLNGNDDNSGLSENSAWKTIKKASEKIYSAGDKILFKAGGVFEGNFVAKGSGTKEKPIIISSYGDIKKDGLPLITSKEDINLISIHNVGGWMIENLEMTAPNGKGVWIIADNEIGVIKDITVKNCVIHDIKNEILNTRGYFEYSPVYVHSKGINANIENLTLSNLEIYNCSRGITLFGVNIEENRDIFVSPEVSYNKNFIFEDIAMNNILYDGIIVTSINGLIVRNSYFINVATREDWPTAALWSHHTKNMLIENCEFAGSTNEKDGMTVDFDGWTTDSTYQYVYSHDNARFVRNCLYDNTTKNANCTVRYCLSVNDRGENGFASVMKSGGYDYTVNDDSPMSMENFKFYNNTVVNSGTFTMFNLSNSYVANNIFYNEDEQAGFRMVHMSMYDNGTRYLRKFSGEFTNNCFYGTAVPFRTQKAIFKNPLFVSDDFTNINSFKLSKNSPLLGKGIQVEADMGEHDFYGDNLTNIHNIGCYGDLGENVEIKENFSSYIKNLFNLITGFFISVWGDIEEIFF